MIIVSNTGPLIGLAKVNHLHLLRSLATAVYIPPQVYRELLAKSGAEAEAIDHALAAFIRIQDPDPVKAGEEGIPDALDEGEKQAILVARNLGRPVLLLMDDRAGRTAAKQLNLRFTGLPGLLLLAKENGLVNQVSPVIQQVRSNGYWLSDAVVNLVKKLADES